MALTRPDTMDSIDPFRRRLLRHAGALSAVAGIGGLLAACERQGDHAASVIEDAGASALPAPSADFMALSRTLTGYADPDPLLAARLHAELTGVYPDLAASVPLIAERLAKAPVATEALADAPRLHELFQQILSGWYLGVLGTSTKARCVGFERIVSYRVVAASEQPPSYCSGEVNFWVHAPT